MAELVVLSFNTWHGGGLPIEATASAIRAAGADVVGVQETRDEAIEDTASAPSHARALAAALGWYVHEQWPPDGVAWERSGLWSNAIVSRYPIGKSTAHDLGATIETPDGPVVLFNLHLDDTPYAPYQLAGIPYDGARNLTRAAPAVRSAARTRGPAIQRLRQDLSGVPSGVPVVITGDFNEPSHRDWTDAAAAAGLHPLAVPFPTVRALEALGFVDAYRAAWPDPVARPGFTWTPTTAPDDPSDHHDRIDYVLARGFTVVAAGVVGPDAAASDVVVTPWPSDHRAVVARLAR